MASYSNIGMICGFIGFGLLVTIFVYIMILKKHRKNGYYTVPGLNTVFKNMWAKQQLQRTKQSDEDYVADFKQFKSEKIAIAYNKNNSDSQLFYGSDDQGNSLLMKLEKQQYNNTDEVWLILRLKGGEILTLPEHPRTNIRSSGLCIETLIDYKSMRITFSGLLRRKGVAEPYSAEDNLIFVKFNFIWASATPPKHYPSDWSISLLSKSVATEPWNGGNWKTLLNLPKFGGYDQFGALLGQVFIENRDEQSDDKTDTKMDLLELNLPGYRKRRILPINSKQQIRRSASIIGVCFDGTVFEIGALSYYEKVTHATFGFVRNSNGESYAIDWTDFHLASIAEDQQSIAPKALNIQFTANKITYSTSIYFVKNSTVELNGNIPSNWLVNTVPVDIGVNGNRGFGISILYYDDLSQTRLTIPNEAPILTLGHSNSVVKTKLVLHFNDMDASCLAISGGKGASLALLNVVKTIDDSNFEDFTFEVPSGFIISANSFDLQMGRNPVLTEAVAAIKNVAYGIGKLENLAHTCDEAVEKFKNVILEREIIDAVRQHFEELLQSIENAANLKFAVRSSAIGEDGDDASSAGQNETFLGLRNFDEILESIKLCWASLFTYQSVEYRRQHIQPIDTKMSVVVQVMVSSDCAGVLFTKHPVNGDPSKILITANYGLGESVVSGMVDPDSYVVRRSDESQALTITQKTIGSKSHFLHMNAMDDGSNVMKKELKPEDQVRACLSDEQILKLSKIGILLEKLYGNARDIEWAIHQNVIYLLQSRPITTLNTLSNWELLHEFDSAVMSNEDLSTFGVLGELFPDVVSPLTISTVMYEMQHRQEEHMKSKMDLYNGRFCNSYVITHSRLCLDIHKMLLSMVGKKITKADKITAITMFGHEFITPEIHRTALHRNENADKSIKRKLLTGAIADAWNNKKNLQANQKMMQTVYNRYSSDGLKDYVGHDSSLFNHEIEFELCDIDRYAAVLHTHFSTSKVSTIYQMLALILLTEGSEDLTIAHYADIAVMLGSCKDVESAEVPKLLQDIAEEIYKRNKADEFVSVEPSDGLKWLDENCSSAAQLFHNFLKRHGHRALKEYDLIAITWSMEPERVISMIQTTVKGITSMNDIKETKIDLSDQDTINMLKSPSKWSTKFMLSKIVPLSKKAVQIREKSKSALISFINELRKAYRHLAILLYTEGLLPDTELIFYLHRDEIAELIREPTKNEIPINKSAIINKAMRRMKLFPTWASYRFDEMNHGVVKPINEDDDKWKVDGNVKHVTGTPVGEGIITARACVIKSFDEVHKIQKGDILVTYGTDIGWSPYFPILGGIVTELGGLISHGAIVAREYGLPCVVGCTGATNVFKFGETITINGAKGVVLKIDDEIVKET